MSANPSGCCGVVIDCCEGELADTVTATIENVSGCDCANGESLPLSWNGEAWIGEKSICGQAWRLELDCGGDLWGMNIKGCESHTLSPSTVQCDPLLLRFTGWELTTCCANWPSTVNIVVTD